MHIETKRLLLVTPTIEAVDKIVDYYIRNRSFLSTYEPQREAFFYTPEYQRMLVQNSIDAESIGQELRFWLEKRDDPQRYIGTIGFTQMIMGPFKSCYLGYRLDIDHLRQGYMYEALEAAIEVMFTAYGLHRLEANIMPSNTPSIALVKKLGFYNEGIAQKYMQINGVWEDHIHMVKRNIAMEKDASLFCGRGLVNG